VDEQLTAGYVRGEIMLEGIESRIEKARRTLESLNYHLDVSAQDLVDYMSAETFAEDRVKLRDVLENEYYLIHELVEVNEWKKRSRIHGRIVVDSPATLVYTIHYIALEKELEYALQRGDYAWIKERIRDQSEDPYMPEEFKPQAKLILEKFIKILKEESLDPHLCLKL
jgi:DNA polymerase III delta prime subunit